MIVYMAVARGCQKIGHEVGYGAASSFTQGAESQVGQRLLDAAAQSGHDVSGKSADAFGRQMLQAGSWSYVDRNGVQRGVIDVTMGEAMSATMQEFGGSMSQAASIGGQA